MDEVRHRSLVLYNKMLKCMSDKRYFTLANEHHRGMHVEKEQGETINDRNDRAIRNVAIWMQKHVNDLGLNIQVVFLTDDAENKRKALEKGLIATSVRDYVETVENLPELADMLYNEDSFEKNDDKAVFEFDNHVSLEAAMQGIQSKRYYQGTLSISMYNPHEGSIFVDSEGLGFSSVVIKGLKNLNRSIQGDSVAVEILPREMWSSSLNDIIAETEDQLDDENKQDEMAVDLENVVPCGRVVAIIKRPWRTYCGSIDPNYANSLYVMVNPMDKRVPRIRIRTKQAQSLLNQRILVAIDKWDINSKYPSGHFVRKLGVAGDRQTETEAILIENDVPFDEFTQSVLDCLPSKDWIVTDVDLPNRMDLRHLDVCSIDPPGCTDIDDALHCVPLPNGNFQVGVHIADVTHFVKPNTPMDTEAAHRSTTVYLVDRRIDMLPSLLGTNLCSLHSNVDRLAFSCIWELNPNGEILNTKFTKSIIRSKESFTYDQAQKRIDDVNLNDSLTISMRALNQLAKKIRKRRMDQGALTLASPEVRFSLENESQDPVDVELKELKDTNALVEEFMLLANVSVAKKIFESFPDVAVLRKHPRPSHENFDVLKQALNVYGFSLDCSTSKSLSDSLDNINLDSDPYFNKIVRIMTTRCMMQAVYFCSGTTAPSDFWHYGLAMDIYTHFTSPIRRYADVLVHRLLAVAIGYETMPPNVAFLKKDLVSDQCDVMNHRHRMAQMASRASIEFFTRLYLKDKEFESEDAYIIKIVKNGFVALVPKYGIEGMIFLSEQGKNTLPNHLKYDPEHLCIYPSDSSINDPRCLKIFGKVKVSLQVINENDQRASLTRKKLGMTLIEPCLDQRKRSLSL
ncbi:mitotic control protein dis3 [Rozella allomycis CSF55]|uniref:Ribosomal RNA-processing protein 44 n=1 Tax=Rozella allomycis (strain CSF55) TaxID=988480 RepID=A0A4P9YLE3_ROZAC|nr:mitotic control protein dis3 [Rozella allomycis CSF55]